MENVSSGSAASLAATGPSLLFDRRVGQAMARIDALGLDLHGHILVAGADAFTLLVALIRRGCPSATMAPGRLACSEWRGELLWIAGADSRGTLSSLLSSAAAAGVQTVVSELSHEARDAERFALGAMLDELGFSRLSFHWIHRHLLVKAARRPELGQAA